jgi:hypothetical protein
MLVVLVLVTLQLVAPSLRNVPHNPLIDLVKTRTDAAIFAFVVMVAGGVREEIQRGFVLRRFEQYLGGGFAGPGDLQPAVRAGTPRTGTRRGDQHRVPRRVLGRDLPRAPHHPRPDDRSRRFQPRAGGEFVVMGA